jgi:hypothetical protein
VVLLPSLAVVVVEPVVTVVLPLSLNIGITNVSENSGLNLGLRVYCNNLKGPETLGYLHY